MDVLQEVLAIKEKISLLKAMDKNFTLYGSEKHRYEFNPTLSEKEVEAFEQKYQVRLPEDYRLFLMRVGNGGAGPLEGIFPLEEAVKQCNPQQPFKWFGFDFYVEIHEFDFHFHTPTAEDIKDREEYRQRNGSIRLYGPDSPPLYCSEYLVVNGKNYGTTWYDQVMSTGETILLGGCKSFIEIYSNHWLDSKLKYFAEKELQKKQQRECQKRKSFKHWEMTIKK